MSGWPGRNRVDTAARQERKRVRDAHAGDYEGAMAAVRRALTDLNTAREHSAVPTVLGAAHERIDAALARAAAAATAVYTDLFNVAGGMYHAESDPEVARWKRHMNAALTLRSQHQLSQRDDEAALTTVGAPARTRAAFGPHQAGLDFDVDLDAST